MNNKLIECVPNFSEGRDKNIIDQITSQIESVDGVRLLDVDAGNATNRTVVTFVGNPESVVDAAFLAIKKASELIDMSKHSGEHPRMGATDVCPFIPVANISIEETIEYAKKLAERVAKELNIPIYLYESAATKPERKNLATVRSGEYEGLAKKLQDKQWQPDYGGANFNVKSGATIIGVRDFLIAYNVNLNTRSTRKANAIAFDVREQGRIKRIGDPVTGEIEKDINGESIRIAGTLKGVKAIGWFIKEFDIAQISMNLTDYNVTSVHQAFDEVVKKADDRGIRVTGSEIVGMVPLKVITDAGKYFLKKQGRSSGVSEKELIHIAVKSLGLDELYKFDPKKKIIEYSLEDNQSSTLINLNLKDFADETASESPAPGGGSISAYVGALGISLATMVANISANKRGWDNEIESMSEYAEQGQIIKDNLLKLVDQDTYAFNQVMTAMSLAKSTNQEKELRNKAIEKANKNAMLVPYQIMETSFKSMEIIKAMAERGNPNSVTDAGVGAMCARTAVIGAFLNVKINASGLDDKAFVDDILAKGNKMVEEIKKLESEIILIVESKIK
ncbi:MAG: glutamate formimidoyltransferase [Candidatus Sericytochromatia bacterium]|nr:glutamate formimidoyltransferase [Candidatus Sericytochromatia bacterium]